MSRYPIPDPGQAPPLAATQLPIVAVVFSAFLVIGLAMPVLPLQVHDGLGLGSFFVGLVAGAQFAASLVSRLWSGHYADHRGAKRAVIAGLLAAAASGALLDLALGTANPTLGLIAERSGISTVFLVSSVVVLGATAIALRLSLAGPGIAHVSPAASTQPGHSI